MKTRTIALTIALLGLMAVVAFAGDITGKWTSEMQGPNGAMTTTYNFKVEGATLTGTVSGRGGDTQITEGKITGDEISFVVVRGQGDRQMKTTYKGKAVSDTEIKFQVGREGAEPREVVAKKAS